MKTVWAETKPVNYVIEKERDKLFELLKANFLGVSRKEFEQDLEEKDSVIILYSRNTPVGFSTIMKFHLEVSFGAVNALFSGDTSVLPEFRSSPHIGSELMKQFVGTLNDSGGISSYYILISKGWRTYRLMPFFFKNYAPAPDVEMSETEKAIIDAFGTMKYPETFDPDTGLIIPLGKSQRVKSDSVDGVVSRSSDPYITFFLEKNPSFLEGNELVCVAEISENNFTRQAERLRRAAEKKEG